MVKLEHRKTAISPLKGVFVIVHGLNIKPVRMQSLCVALENNGYDTINVSLHGHYRECGVVHTTTEIWLNDITEALALAKKIHPNIIVLAYSMGALITTVLINRFAEHGISRMIFLAPAVTVRTWVMIFSNLRFVFPRKFYLPSFLPELYRARFFVSLTWYYSLMELVSICKSLEKPAALSAVPTKIFIHRHDEFISCTKLQRWIDQNNLQKAWTISHINNQGLRGLVPKHLVIDEEALGTENWKKLLQDIFTFVAPATTSALS